MFSHNRIQSVTHLTYVTQPLSENLRVGEKRNGMNIVAPIVLFRASDFKSFTVTQLCSIFVSSPISHDGELNLGWAIGLHLNHLCVFFFNVLRFLGWGMMRKFWISVCSFTLISVTQISYGRTISLPTSLPPPYVNFSLPSTLSVNKDARTFLRLIPCTGDIHNNLSYFTWSLLL